MNIAFNAVKLAEALAGSNVIFLADDDQQAERVASALAALRPEDLVQYLPSSDTLPGDSAPASPSNIGKRVAALRAVRRTRVEQPDRRIALVLSGEAAARRYSAPEAFDSAPPTVSAGMALELDTFVGQLAELGYFPDDRVDEPGEMAVRGDVIDIFPADAASPVRLEMGEGRIGLLRAFDPTTQLTIGTLESLEIGRAAEPELCDAVPILRHLDDALVGFSEKADRRRLRFLGLASDAARRTGAAIDAIDDNLWLQALREHDTLDSRQDFAAVPRFAEARAPLASLARFIKPLVAEGRSFILAGSERDVRFLRSKICGRLALELNQLADHGDLTALEAGAAGSFICPVDAGYVDERLVIVTASDILGSRARLDDLQLAGVNPLTASNAELRVGDIVIHEDHGVARIAGLEAAPEGNAETGELICLEFSAGGRRLIAAEDADRIWRYGTDADAVTLDKLDGSSWFKRRSAIDAAIEESARGLALLADARAKLQAPVIEPDAAAYEKFANGFAYNETADQARAIGAVRSDLASGKPMDRLVVGDVGYGKTEVAIRAAAIAALAGFQVVVAAPTTVLVRQHLENFRERFEAAGISVAGLSRLSSSAEKKAVKAGLADGSLQVVIGTGAVMAKGVSYAKLGLVIIDEEQRFGAADKAKLRGSGSIHLLTLSATPIPRTLQMALIGLQAVSVIATPPARRQPVRTSLDQWDDTRVRTALSREKGRGGQSFVVVPRIEDMPLVAENLRRIVPDFRLIEAHGKMSPAAIDEAMVSFAKGEGDILLATNIIEAGLDVPRANTMIVWRADRFGLAQLHQLRGRVGRGNRRGQVVLLTQANDAIGERTLKRLRTLAASEQLGAGFELSARDLDMRGAGDLLGESQAGHIKMIGTDLYQHLLSTALRRARGEEVERWAPQLHLGVCGMLPPSWIPEADVRLGLYVRLARIDEPSELENFEAELADRFGPLPPEAEALLTRAAIRAAAHSLRIDRIDAGPAAIAITTRRGFEADPGAAGLHEKGERLVLSERTDQAQRHSRVQSLLDELASAS